MTTSKPTLRQALRGLLLFATLLIAMPHSVVRAATITVTNTNDSGTGSLRQAIADANSGDTSTSASPATSS